MNVTLRIRLLGGFYMVYGDTVVTSVTSPRQRSLLTNLLIHRNTPQPRRTIASQLWPESSEKQAMTNLRRELFHLRRNLPEAEQFIQAHHQMLAWRPESSFLLDVAGFESEITRAKQARMEGKFTQVVEALRNALAIYKGPLIPEIYEEWILPHREDLRHQYVRIVEQLFEIAASSGDYTAATHYGERMLKQDPLQESWYRKLIRLHVSHGNQAEAVRVYNLCAETLHYELGVEPSPMTRRMFQHLVTGERTEIRRHNFPPQSTPFVGRKAAIAELAKALGDEECRLLTLTGPGGIGKTRLAIQAALAAETEIIAAFEDGIFFVGLVSVESPDQMLPAIAETLGVTFLEGEDPERQLLDYLSGKSVLLLLDNFEHLQQGKNFIVLLGRYAPRAKVLVTSRERLNLKREWVYEVKGLGYATQNADEGMENPSAIQLFFERASRIHVELAHLDVSFPAVGRICHLLEGNPLAIELAASWAGALSLEGITAEIESGLDLLTSSQVDVPHRHRSMRAVFEHSWKLLSHEEQKVLRQLSVFQGRFNRLSAREIAGGSLRLLTSLVDKSMLHYHPAGYYEMHLLLKQYAAEKLASHPKERDRVGQRYIDYYLDYLQNQEAGLRGKDQSRAAGKISSEMDNILSAWSQAIERENFQALVGPAQTLYLFYDLRGRFKEGTDRFDIVAEALRSKIENSSANVDDLALFYRRLRIFQASMYYRLGRYDEAQDILDDCRASLETAGPEAVKAQILLRLGQIAFRRGAYQTARVLLEESLEILRETQDRWETATALSFLGDVMRSLGEYNLARTYLFEGLAIRKEIGNPTLIADSLNTLGIVISALGDYDRALELFQESLAIRRSLDDPWGIAKTLNNLAILRTWMDDNDRAGEHFRESLALRRQIGNPFGIAVALHNLADLAFRYGDYLEAEELFHEALTIRRRIDMKPGIASSSNMLALIALKTGDEQTASRYFREALQIATEIQAVPLMLAISDGIAELLIQRGQQQLAAEVLSLIVAHPAVESDPRQRARERLLRLRERLHTDAGGLPTGQIVEGDVDRLAELLLAAL